MHLKVQFVLLIDHLVTGITLCTSTGLVLDLKLHFVHRLL